LNSSIHDERRPRWMDLLFDLVLVGFQTHIWELFNKMLSDTTHYISIGFLLSGYGIIAILWQTSQKYRNRYHSSGTQDTLVLCIMIMLAIFAIRNLHHCTESVVCSDDSMKLFLECRDTSLGVAMLYLFYGFLNLWVRSANKKFRLHNMYEAICFFIGAVGWFVVLIAPLTAHWFRFHYIVSTILILIFRPLMISISTKLKNDYQPQNISYLRERLGLLVIVNLAIVVEQSFEHDCRVSEFKICDRASDGGTLSFATNHSEDTVHHEVHDDDHEPVGIVLYYLSYSTFFLAFFMKILYFNLYDYSEMEEQISKYKYQSINGIRLTLVYFLAIGLSLISADEKITLCELLLKDVEDFDEITYILAVFIITITLTIHHYLNTKRAKKKWNEHFWAFIGLRASICVICYLLHACDRYIHIIDQDSAHITIFIALFSISLFIEHNVLKLPTRYGANRDKTLRRKLDSLEGKNSVR
jgi:hypothetical protein